MTTNGSGNPIGAVTVDGVPFTVAVHDPGPPLWLTLEGAGGFRWWVIDNGADVPLRIVYLGSNPRDPLYWKGPMPGDALERLTRADLVPFGVAP